MTQENNKVLHLGTGNVFCIDSVREAKQASAYHSFIELVRQAPVTDLEDRKAWVIAVISVTTNIPIEGVVASGLACTVAEHFNLDHERVAKELDEAIADV